MALHFNQLINHPKSKIYNISRVENYSLTDEIKKQIFESYIDNKNNSYTKHVYESTIDLLDDIISVIMDICHYCIENDTEELLKNNDAHTDFITTLIETKRMMSVDISYNDKITALFGLCEDLTVPDYTSMNETLNIKVNTLWTQFKNILGKFNKRFDESNQRIINTSENKTVVLDSQETNLSVINSVHLMIASKDIMNIHEIVIVYNNKIHQLLNNVNVLDWFETDETTSTKLINITDLFWDSSHYSFLWYLNKNAQWRFEIKSNVHIPYKLIVTGQPYHLPFKKDQQIFYTFDHYHQKYFNIDPKTYDTYFLYFHQYNRIEYKQIMTNTPIMTGSNLLGFVLMKHELTEPILKVSLDEISCSYTLEEMKILDGRNTEESIYWYVPFGPIHLPQCEQTTLSLDRVSMAIHTNKQQRMNVWMVYKTVIMMF
jgi:uncharacterized protein YegP (UPF0339 family)